jgi:hypothetical protein
VPVEQSSTLRACWRHEVSAKQAERCSYGEKGHKLPVPVTDSAIFTTPEADDEEADEDLDGLDNLLSPLILPTTLGLTCFV